MQDFFQSECLMEMLEKLEKEPLNCKSELALLLHHHISNFSEAYNGKSLNGSCGLIMKNFIERNLTVPLNMDDIAAQVHLSRKLELAQNLLRSTREDYLSPS